MKKGLTELVFILDRSGSMSGLELDTIGGFNGLIKKQKKQEGEANVTTVLFDDQYEILHDRIPLQAIRPMTEKQYYVRGCTALLDAIGKTIHKMITVQKNTSEDYRAEKVIFVITTDGLENSSREYSHDKIKKLIQTQKENYHWEFMFLGANMDAVAEAKKFGINEDRAVTYENDSEGIALNYKVVADAVCCMRASSMPIKGEWKDEIVNDVKRRFRK